MGFNLPVSERERLVRARLHILRKKVTVVFPSPFRAEGSALVVVFSPIGAPLAAPSVDLHAISKRRTTADSSA
jgi:hypothetical protein